MAFVREQVATRNPVSCFYYFKIGGLDEIIVTTL